MATDKSGNPATVSVTYTVVTGGGGGSTSADLTITIAPAKLTTGTLTYVMTISNAGHATASGVAVSDAIPIGTTFTSASASQGTISAPPVGGGGLLIVNLGTLAKAATATVNLVVSVTAYPPATIMNTATVSATTQDLNSGNNTATRKTSIK